MHRESTADGHHRARPRAHALGRSVRANLSTAELYEDAIRHGEGLVAADGPLVVRTGKHTGRSPEDKFIVDEPSSHDKIWWGEVNRPISEAHYDRLRARLVAYAASKDLYSQDCFIGAAPAHRRSPARRTPRRPGPASSRATCSAARAPTSCAGFAPNFTIICVPSFQADPETEGTRTGTAILVHLRRMEILIVGTEYAGEIKKSAFTVMNYLMPDEGVLPMHSAINVGQDGDAAVFFGLSGTGKTTLSADPARSLIGDDEHGWGDGVTFNFEGGCYAKTIRLSPMYEPDIFQTTRRFGTVLENVDLDPRTRELDLDSERFTENTRGAYPLEFIGNADATGMAGHPRTVVLLTADAFGVLPPISRLTHEQAAYHFISGYTAKLAGTEVGVKEPKATFSACFGAPFMPRHPGEYAAMLVERLERDDVPVWLVNTGWTGGPYGVGERMNIAHTRAMVRAALDGALATVPTRLDPNFGVEVPLELPGRAGHVPRPARDLGRPGGLRRGGRRGSRRCSAANFAAYADGVAPAIAAAGPGAPGSGRRRLTGRRQAEADARAGSASSRRARRTDVDRGLSAPITSGREAEARRRDRDEDEDETEQA